MRSTFARWPAAAATRVLAAVAALFWLAVACQELDVSAVDVDQVSVEPDNATVAAGETRQLTATVTDAAGRQLRGRTVSWSSDDPGIAQVDADGQVRGMAAGSTRITATAEGHSGQATINVTSGNVATVEVTPNPLNLRPGETVQLEAVARALDGSVVAGGAVVWGSDDNGVATVSSGGSAAGVAAGATRITATVEGRTGATAVTVTTEPVETIEVLPGSGTVAVGETFQLQALVKAADGSVLSGRPVSWSSSAAGVATVDASGRVTGVSPGEARVSASAEGRSGESVITVTPGGVASVSVSPSTSSVAVGATVQLEAVALAADGSEVPGRTFVWSTDNDAIAAVDQQGLVTGRGLGTANISASADGHADTARVLVTNVAIATLELQPAGGDIVLGDSLDLTAIARDQGGTVLQNRTVLFSSSSTGVATVASTGGQTALIKAVGTGETTITAVAEGIVATATFRVVPKPVANVAVTPGSANIIIDATVQLTATLTAADGSALTGRPVSWSSSDANIAAVDGNGLVRGVAVGLATITATSEGRTGTASISVGLKPVDKVVVQPAADTLLEGESVQLTAVLTAADGTVLTGRAVTWATSDGNIAQVDGNGRVTAKAAGTATITATSEGKSGQAQIRVDPKPIASIEVQPASATVLPPATQTYQAVVRAADGSVLTNRQVQWRSLNTNVATVAAGGGVGLTATATPAAQPACGGQSCTVTIEASAGGVTGTASLTVQKPIATIELAPTAITLAPGASASITPTVKAADGTVLTGRTLNWSSNSANASVPASAPLQQAVTVQAAANVSCNGQSCSVTITAAAGGKSATAVVTIPKPVSAVAVVPGTLTLEEGDKASVQAVVTAADNTVLTNRQVSWTTTSSSVATVASGGGVGLDATVSALTCATGSPTCTATIRATAEGVTGNLALTVQKPVDKVEVAPAILLVPQGGTGQLAATVTAADGTQLTNRRVQWSSSASSVATVTGTGPNDQNATVTGAGLGLATITARVGNRSGTAAVTVLEPVATIELVPPSADLAEGASLGLQAVLKGASGAVLANRTVTWSTTNASIASATGSGQFLQQANLQAGQCPTGTPSCTATITAAAEGKSATLVATVRKQVASIDITPDPAPDLLPGQTVQFTAVPRANDGTNLGSVAPVSWASSNGGLASVTPDGGLVTAAAAVCAIGQTACPVTITASAGGHSEPITVRVLKHAVQVVIAPNPIQDLLPGETVQLTAVITAADGTDLSNARPVTWASSVPGTAQVDGNGLVTAAGAACPVGEAVCVARVTASADNVTDDVEIRVLKPVDSIIVTPDPGAVQLGQMLQFSAQVLAADGTDLTAGRVVTWQANPASPPGAVTLSATTGTSVTVTGTAEGTVVLTATAGGKSKQVTVTITP